MKYGRQFDVRSYTTVLPVTEQGIRRYCPGVTRAVRNQITSHALSP